MATTTDSRTSPAIASEHYFTAMDGAYAAVYSRVLREGGGITPEDAATRPEVLGRITYCVLVLSDGQVVSGKSICASSGTFSPEIGQRNARANAIKKILGNPGFLTK